MNTRKINILGIVPYQSLKTSMISIAEAFPNIKLSVYVGNLDAGVELARQYMNDGFDIILSRGGTATLIRQIATIPVIEVPLSVYDILRTIKLTSVSAEACAVIGFPSITSSASLLCSLMHYDIAISTIHQKSEVAPALKRLKKNGCQFVLCDVIAETLARQAGMNPILITSGPESVQKAFEEAIQTCSFSFSLMQRCSVLEDALKNRPADTIILNQDGSIYYSNYDAENITSVLDYLRSLIQKPSKSACTKAFHLIDNVLFALTAQKAEYDGSVKFLFYIESNPVPAGSSKYGLRFSSYKDIVDMYTNSFYALTSGARVIQNQIDPLTTTKQPIMILGESGTGKNQVAARLFMEGPLKNNPYIIIDCPLISERNWSFLTKHYNSPLFDKNNTIFISNVQELPTFKQQQLLSVLLDTNAHKRNRIILSCSQTLKESTADPSSLFIKYLACATVFLPPLRELAEDIPTSSNLYLNALNLELSKSINGFDPDALTLLCSYSWPDNFMQLKKVLADLVLQTTTEYIQADTVRLIFEKEARQYTPQKYDTFNYDRPLNVILQDIVKVVLARCNGNQTKAARQLGIGRTTLWRYLSSE